MGSGMVKNLTDKGHHVVAFDVNAPIRCVGENMSWAKSPADVASQAQTVITMLPNNEIVREVYKGQNGILSTALPDAFLIDSSTVDPLVCHDIAKAAEEKNVVFIDAPVSGGVNAAKAGTLTFMVGAGETEQYEKAKKLLLDMGKVTYHCGKVGTGQAVKICNNMLLAISMIGTCEVMNLGIQ